MSDPDFPARPEPLPPEALKAQKSRNFWLAMALFGFVILVGAITVVRLSGTDGTDFYYNIRADNPAEPGNELPPGMTPDQAAPPPGLIPDEPAPETGSAPE